MGKSLRPLALSLFSGAGGMDLGVTQAGFKIVACVELDPYCCETLRLWASRKRPQPRVIEADIRQLDPADVMRDLQITSGQLDLLFGGPPCQAFSQIGKRNSLHDDRGQLLFEIARFASRLKPRAILVEQVTGVLNAPDTEGKVGGAFDLFISQLEKLGYHPMWRVINTADYGVPQLRKRVFVVGFRGKIDFAFPDPTHKSNEGNLSLFPHQRWVVVGEALADLPKPPRLGLSPPADSHADVTPAGDRRRIHGVPEGGHLSSQLQLPPAQRGGLTKKDTTKFRRLSRFEPSITLRCGEIFFHPSEDRYLTPREYMRIHGYPDTYHLCGPIRGRSGQAKLLDQHRQVANSVPPPVARVLAGAVLDTLRCRVSSKSSDTR